MVRAKFLRSKFPFMWSMIGFAAQKSFWRYLKSVDTGLGITQY